MEPFPSASRSDLPPKDLSFGYGGIEFFPIESIVDEQAGYIGSGWSEGWLVVARETLCGDPIFVDRAVAALPVFTAMHGTGDWDTTIVAPSWPEFWKGLLEQGEA
ncbi:MAG: hypothetical protein JO133_04170 [Burkholderiaceae bacterium]|nr:hypothetical protein [Burkholderiaceae bacterium]